MTLAMLKTLIKQKDIAQLRYVFAEYNIVDMADLVDQLDTSEALFVFKTLKKHVTSEIFSYLPYDKQEALIEVFTGPEIQAMLDNLYSDDIVDFMEEMPANIVKRILQNVKPMQRVEINKLLNYREDSCGSIMNTNYITLKRTEDVKQSIERLKQLKNIDRALGYAYITDNKRELIGSLSLKQLLYESDHAKIEDIMDTNIVYVNTGEDQEKAAQLIEKYDISTLPVVNDEGKLAGAITYDDIIDVIHAEATEDIHRMGGISPNDKPYLEIGVMSMYKNRIVWLLVLMIGATFTGNVLLVFEDRLHSIAYLSVFIPMLMDAAGNAGNQSSTMITRALALGELRISDMFNVWFKEFRVAILCGITMGVANFLRVLLFMGMIDVQTSIVVSMTVMCTVMVAKLIGCTLPMIAVKLGFDPAVMAGPLITTLVDVVALLIYFGLASWLLL